ncbi:MAG TPA: SWIM zinc finger family protein [Ktedonobacteraceae bacterium]|jgi:uncharacterized Zn finger protein|nr:SWIM zinc finger family protein [Ktedonobacteraceae bacterium]
MDGRYEDFHWDYYSYDRPRKVQNGIKAKNERGTMGETWWSRRWLQALENLGMGSRLSRGRLYARQGQVLSIDLKEGEVKAQVQGSLREPYKVTIHLQVLSKAEWERATDAMAGRAIFAAKLLANEMPTAIEEAFQEVQLSLFPTTDQDLKTRCTCPDWANPCKHSAAVYYILAERFDEDPFLLFKLRGRSQEALLAALRKKRLAALPAEPAQSKQTLSSPASAADTSLRLEQHLETFWQCAESLESFAITPHNPAIERAILKRLGPAPYSIGKENLSMLLARIYDQVEEAALNRAENEEL